MKFGVRRTTERDGGKPCDEAVYLSGKTDDRYWAIEIDSLDELMAFVEKYEVVVIEKPMSPDRAYEPQHYLPTLEIYDGYRE